MFRSGPVHAPKALLAAAAGCLLFAGCTSFREYVDNGFKVGPNYCTPGTAVSEDSRWIDAADPHLRVDAENLSHWWTVFNDPVLDGLIHDAYCQNLNVKQAAFRVLQARSVLAIARGNILPQTQTADGDFTHTQNSGALVPGSPLGGSAFSAWSMNFNLQWELDFWGNFRRQIESADAQVGYSVADYDNVLVTLLGDVARNYVQVRTSQRQIEVQSRNITEVRRVLKILETRLKEGNIVGITGEPVDVAQFRCTAAQIEAQIPAFEIAKRTAENQLCILLGMLPSDIRSRLGDGPIPMAPPEVAIGIPADLVRRRPDVRQAERAAAAQSAQIGVAEADLYPHFYINGSIGYEAQRFSDLFGPNALAGSVGPSFSWNILNYGRLVNNVRLQDQKFQELVLAYQQSVLTATGEVENGLVQFLRSQEECKSLAEAVAGAEKALGIMNEQVKGGTARYDQMATVIQVNLVPSQNLLAQAQQGVAVGLINAYQAMGGGWELRLTEQQPAPAQPQAQELIPPPDALTR